MNCWKLYGAVSIFVVSLLISEAALATAVQCEGCSATQMRTKAISLGEGVHVVSSLSTHTIRSYRVDPNPDGYPQWLVKEKAVPVDVQENFQGALELYSVAGPSMQAAIEIPADQLDGVSGLNGASAYDVMTNVNLKGQIADRLANGALPGLYNLDRAGEQLVQWGFSKIGLSADASIEIVVEFSDGTSMVFKLVTNQASADYLEGRSRTAGGQVIPESNSAGSQGTWTSATGDNLDDMASYLDRIGSRMTFVPPAPNSAIRKISCTWDGQTLTCRVE